MNNRTCVVEGCSTNSEIREHCKIHYLRKYRSGDLETTRNHYTSPQESFAARTEWQGDCLIWTGSKTANGYGQIWVDGRLALAHRYAWEQANGTIPSGYRIDHKDHCDVACCNAKHLRLATENENKSHRTGPQKNHNSSGVRNVYKHRKKWQVKI